MEKLKKLNKENLKIGFIGQGWIGKNYADNFEERGFNAVRYSLEKKYKGNGDKVDACDIVFIAVPTPTTPKGFDDSILINAIKKVSKTPKIIVIKSTIIPGTTQKLQDMFKKDGLVILHSPEFLTEATAKFDASHPKRNIIGVPEGIDVDSLIKLVMSILPDAPYKAIVPAKVAELVKYAGNCWFYFKVIYINLLYDLANKLGIDYEMVKEAMSFDPRIGFSHLDPIHHDGRGAGGDCFIKDFRVFSKIYGNLLKEDFDGRMILEYMEQKNIELLIKSNKSLDILSGVYGKERVKCDFNNYKKYGKRNSK